MILQALTEYYQVLEREGKIAAPGWSPVKVSFALCLGADGTLEQVVSLQTQQQRGKKTALAPQSIPLPAPVKRTVGVAPNFLCDNSSYLLGIDSKGRPRRTAECFSACKALHESLLKDVDSPAAQAVLDFFRSWAPERVWENPVLAGYLEDILSGGNLVFRTKMAMSTRTRRSGGRGKPITTLPETVPRVSASSPARWGLWKISTPPSSMWQAPNPAVRPWCPATPRPSAPMAGSRT